MAPIPMNIKNEDVNAAEGMDIVQSIKAPIPQRIKKEEASSQSQELHSIHEFRIDSNTDATLNSNSESSKWELVDVDVTVNDSDDEEQEDPDEMPNSIPLLSPDAIGAGIYHTATESHPTKLCGLTPGPHGSVQGRIVIASCFDEKWITQYSIPREQINTAISKTLQNTESVRKAYLDNVPLQDLDRDFCHWRFFHIDGWITIGEISGEQGWKLLTRDAVFYSESISAPLKCEVRQLKEWVPDFKISYSEDTPPADYVLKADKAHLRKLSLMSTIKLSRDITCADQWMPVEAWGVGGRSRNSGLRARVKVQATQGNRYKLLIAVELRDERWITLWGWMRKDLRIGRFRLVESGLQPGDYIAPLACDDLTLSVRTRLPAKSRREIEKSREKSRRRRLAVSA